MNRFQLRMDLATKRSTRVLGAVPVKWKETDEPVDGVLGSEYRAKEAGGKRQILKRDLTVRKALMPASPVPGRELWADGRKYECESFDHDVVSWTLHLTKPKQAGA